MAWLKRNPGLVAGAVVALALMGLAGWYLWTKIQEEARVTQELEQANQRFNSLLMREIHPGNEEVNNIELAKEQAEALKKLLADVRGKIGRHDLPEKISNQEFRALLDNTITELQREAKKLGITLPQTDYWFTFSPQRTLVEFNKVDMLMQQLMDIKALVDILYAAKIHDLESLKRVPAATEDNNQTDFLADKKPTTNSVAIVTPYEITFNGFSSELANVLEGLLNAEQCFVVRSVGVGKAQEKQADGMNPFGTGTGYPMSSTPMSRYGQPQRIYNPQMMYGHQPPKRAGDTLLDEEKLKFVLLVDVVRLKPDERAGAGQVAANPYMNQGMP